MTETRGLRGAAVVAQEREGLSPAFQPSVMRWEPLIVEYAERYDLDPGLVAAVITVESSGVANATSYAGAAGLMQVMPYHPQRFPNRPSASALYEPQTNLDWGCRILSREMDWADGNLTLALGSYFDGRARSLAGWARTRAYARKVLEHYVEARLID